MSESLAIAQVTPYPWESGHEVNAYVAATAAQLADRGHRVLIVAPSDSPPGVREARRAVRAGGDELFGGKPGDGASGAVRVLPVGESLPPLPGHARGRAMPIDVARTVQALFAHDVLDICHVHDPFAPSVASVALRHSTALNVGGFHAPDERIVAAQVARKLVRLVFGRLDARVADYPATAALMERAFPGAYQVLAPAAEAPAAARGSRRGEGGRARIVFVEEEERGALRLFMRALRRMPDDAEWEAVVVSARGPSSSTALRAGVRERLRFVAPSDVDLDALLASADALVAASDGTSPAPALLRRAAAAGAVVVAARLGIYEDALESAAAGLLFEPRDEATLAAQLERVTRDPALRRRLRASAPRRTWGEVADDLEGVYGALVGRRHDGRGRPDLRERLRARPLIDVDLHMHTDHSSDCATPVEVLLATARDQGLGAIAVTDHNEISGALEAQAKAADFGVKVIVGEEVKTASQGEVIGLFLGEKIARGMTLAETVAEIKRQSGVVYVPHPFDRMHAVPDYEHLLGVVEEVDAMEVYNPRVAIGSFNQEAARFAAKYRIPAGAGSDSHVAQGLGSVRIRMPDFDGPEEFLEALRMADIVTKPSSLLYVQALKFLETKATPAPARRARRERRVKRATRKG